MKLWTLIITVIFLSSCSGLRTPEQTGVTISSILNQLQVAIDKINSETQNSSLPAFAKAEITLSAESEVVDSQSVSLFLSGENSDSRTDSNEMVFVLVPNTERVSLDGNVGVGNQIAKYVIASINAIDQNNFLKLQSLTVTAGLNIVDDESGGIEVEIVGISIEGGRQRTTTTGHSMKLVFGTE